MTIDREKRQVTMSRVFNAPRELVFKTYTDPSLIPEWWGQEGSPIEVDTMDFKVGGKWRFVGKDDKGSENAFRGEYLEINEPDSFTYTFEWEPMAGHVLTETISFNEVEGGKTELVAVSTYTSIEDLDGMVSMGMESGAISTWKRFDALLEKQKSQ